MEGISRRLPDDIFTVYGCLYDSISGLPQFRVLRTAGERHDGSAGICFHGERFYSAARRFGRGGRKLCPLFRRLFWKRYDYPGDGAVAHDFLLSEFPHRRNLYVSFRADAETVPAPSTGELEGSVIYFCAYKD